MGVVSLLTMEPASPLTLAMILSTASGGLLVAFATHATRQRRLGIDRAHRSTLAEPAKTRFVSVLSHAIRTPLQAIIGATELLRRADACPGRRDDVAAAQRQSADVLMALVGDVLDFAKLEAGKLDLDVAPMQLAVLPNEMRALFAPQAAAKGVALTTTVSPDLPARSS